MQAVYIFRQAVNVLLRQAVYTYISLGVVRTPPAGGIYTVRRCSYPSRTRYMYIDIPSGGVRSPPAGGIYIPSGVVRSPPAGGIYIPSGVVRSPHVGGI